MIKDKKKHKYNPANERVKYKYRQHLRGIDHKDEKTIIASLKNIRDYELFMDFAGFEKFNSHIASKYVQSLLNSDVSSSYITDTLRALKDFLRWLERQRGYRSKINYNDIDFLNVSRNHRNAAKAKEYQKSYSFDQILKTVRKMPSKTDKERRDKAMVSLQAICTLRISELRTVKLKNLIEQDGRYFIYVCPKNMNVKFGKTRHVVFIPLPDDIITNVIDWRDYLRSIGFSESDPLFPKVDNRFGTKNLLEQKIKKEIIKSDTTIRNVFKKAFIEAGFEYIRPHSFRSTLARYAQTQSPAFLNAVRQNLGHESIDTTLSSYGHLSVDDQIEIISSVKLHNIEQEKPYN
ncbi:MAG: site-specific integrase [Alphaproteobacteria bacterium]|nr:site-specific integrase [Alphaproteobacteria bacterium]NCQ88996.1 site-specific integrase [Alphaproteobacteria bacterium]NCT07897.1 site-specific integrase [Alphaproteobacteria bacterium]